MVETPLTKQEQLEPWSDGQLTSFSDIDLQLISRCWEVTFNDHLDIWLIKSSLCQVYLFSLLGSQSDSDSLASEEGVNDDNTDDELSKVVGGLEFAIDRQDKDSKVEDKKPTAEEGITPKDEKATEDIEKKPLHQLQSVSA